MNLAKKVVLGLCICGIYSNVVFAAPADYDQQQQAKRQEEQQKAQINAPKVKLQEKQKKSGEVVFPKEPFRFKINEFVIGAGKTSKFNWLQRELDRLWV